MRCQIAGVVMLELLVLVRMLMWVDVLLRHVLR